MMAFFSPELVAGMLLFSPLAAAAMLWIIQLAFGPRKRGGATTASRVQDVVTVAMSALSLVLNLVLAHMIDDHLSFQILFIDFYLDSLSIFFLLLVSIVAFAASLYVGPSWSRLSGDSRLHEASFHTLFNLFHFTMVLVPMVSNLIVLWIGIELTTVTSTILIAADRSKKRIEAAWKYIMITSTGIIFALLGTLFLARAIPEDGLTMEWPDLLPIVGELDPNLTRLSFLFILVGYGTKAGFAPMHTWLPDSHGEAPFPISALLSGVLLKTALYVILRFYTITNGVLDDGGVFTSRIMLATGLLSLILAVPFILKENVFKRVLAYHSLEHMGIIAVGIGIGARFSMFGAVLHVLNHGVIKSLMFLAFGNVQDAFDANNNDLGRADPPTGVLRAMPWTGSLLVLGGLALVGAPPFNIFLSELFILWGAYNRLLDEPSLWLIGSTIIFVVSVTVVFAGLMRHLSRLLLGPPTLPAGQPESPRRILPLVALLYVALVVGVVIPSQGLVDLKTLVERSVDLLCAGGECR